MTDQVRTLVARIGAHALHSQRDSRELTAAARAAFFTRFVDQVDPNRELPEAERLKRAEHALREHMTRLSLASAKARVKKAAAS